MPAEPAVVAPTSRPRLAFLGVGWIGRARLEAIAASGAAEIVGLADPAEELLAAASTLAPGAPLLRELADLLALEPDGVVIATPSALHAEHATAALEAGCAVFCQKPLGRHADEVARIIATARQADRLLHVDLSYRFVAGLQKMKTLIERGELGEIFAANLVFHNAYGPGKSWFFERSLAGGGCVIDLGIHLVDAVLWLLGTQAVEVSGEIFAGGKRLSPAAEQVEDFATARLVLESGAVAQLACSWHLHAGCDAVIEVAVYGTRGGVRLHNLAGSFTDFQTEHFTGTSRRVVASPPDAWGGRAAVAWAQRLAQNRRYDPEIEQQINVAAVLDRIYGREHVPAAPRVSAP